MDFVFMVLVLVLLRWWTRGPPRERQSARFTVEAGWRYLVSLGVFLMSFRILFRLNEPAVRLAG
jgi:hypothetical protein